MRRYVFIGLFILFFAGAFPTALAIQAPRLRVEDFFIGFPICLWAVAAFVRCTESNGRGGWISITFWAFCYVFLGVAPFVQFTTMTFTQGDSYRIEEGLYGTLVCIAGLAAFHLAQAWMRSYGRKADALNTGGLAFQRVSIARVVTLVVAATLISASALAFLGQIVFFGSRADKFELLLDVTAQAPGKTLLGTLTTIMQVPSVIAALALIALWRRSKFGVRPSLAMRITMWLTIALALLMSNPISTARYWAGSALLGMLFAWLPWHLAHRSTRWIVITSMLLALLFAFPYSDLYRQSLEVDLMARVSESHYVDEIAEKGDYDAFQQIMNAIRVVDKTGVQLGRQLLAVVGFWYPRDFWPGKSEATGTFVTSRLGYSNTNVSMPLWGEFYVDFGVVGVLIGMAFYGVMLARLENVPRVATATNLCVDHILVPLIAGYQIYLLRGPMLPAFAYLAPALLLTIMLGTSRRRRPNRAAIAH